MNLQTINLCYRYDHWTFEPDQYRLIWHDGFTCELTPHETQLLTKLCHHAGEVIGFGQLNQTLFFLQMAKSPPSPPTLEETIFSLRKKLTKHPKHPFIIDEVTAYGLRAPIPNQTMPTPANPPRNASPQQTETSHKFETPYLRQIIALSSVLIGLIIAITHFI